MCQRVLCAIVCQGTALQRSLKGLKAGLAMREGKKKPQAGRWGNLGAANERRKDQAASIS